MIHSDLLMDFAIMKLVHVSAELDMMVQNVINAHLVIMGTLGADLVAVIMQEVNRINVMVRYVIVMNLDSVNAK